MYVEQSPFLLSEKSWSSSSAEKFCAGKIQASVIGTMNNIDKGEEKKNIN